MTSDIIDIVCLVGMAEGRYVMGFGSDIMDEGKYMRFSYTVDRPLPVYHKIQCADNYKNITEHST